MSSVDIQPAISTYFRGLANQLMPGANGHTYYEVADLQLSSDERNPEEALQDLQDILRNDACGNEILFRDPRMYAAQLLVSGVDPYEAQFLFTVNSTKVLRAHERERDSLSPSAPEIRHLRVEQMIRDDRAIIADFESRFGRRTRPNITSSNQG